MYYLFRVVKALIFFSTHLFIFVYFQGGIQTNVVPSEFTAGEYAGRIPCDVRTTRPVSLLGTLLLCQAHHK